MLFTTALVQSQDFTNLAIDGLVKEETGGRLTGAKVALYRDGVQVETQTSERNGRFEFFLDFDHEFTIRVSKSGFVEKIIYVNTHGVPPDEQAFGYEWPITVELFTRVEGVDYSLLEKPIGKIYYEERVQNFVGDNAYMRQIEDELKRLENEQKAAIKAAERRKEQLQEDFELAIKDAELAMKDGDYLTAKDNLLAAESIQEGTPEVQALLAQVNEQLNAEGAKEDRYLSALSSADKAFGNGEWESAIASYTEAIGIKPDEQYPKDKIKESKEMLSKQRLAEEAAQAKAAEANRYNNLIAQADEAFDQGEFRKAKELYRNAVDLKDEDYPKGRIALADEALAKAAAASKEAEAEAQVEARYQDRLDKANAAFASENWSNAKTLYNEALSIKPEATLPKERLIEIDEQIAALAAQQAEETKKAQLEQQFLQAMREGDKSKRDGDLDAAESFYNQALSLKPTANQPKEALESVAQERQRLAEEQSKQAEQKALNDRYNAVIKEADVAYNEQRYETAKARYAEALEIKSREAYPDAQLRKVEQALLMKSKEEEKERAYQAFMDEADARMEQEAYESAIEQLREALKVKPEDPKAMKLIERADKKIQEQLQIAKQQAEKEERQLEFNRLIKDADQAFDAEQYQLALNKYKDALAIQDDDRANEQLAKARQLLNKQQDESNRVEMEKERKRKYSNALEKAKMELAAKEYDKAKETYNLAGTFAADETEHLDGLKQVDALLAQRAAEEQRAAEIEAEKARKEEQRAAFNQLIREGSMAMTQGSFEEARQKFQEADRLIPGDPTPKDKLNQLEGLIKEAERKEQKAAFDEVVAKADKAFISEELDQALEMYKQALAINNASTHVQERITKCQQLISERDSVQKVAEEDSHRRVIEETYDEGRTKVTVRRVIKDGKEEIYKRVVHSWGGRYYFLDDQPITELVWNRETAK
jgi:tetratricopeptide (TPR) repeat protein